MNDGTEDSEPDVVIVNVEDRRIFGITPAYSPDGSQIVFALDDIFILNSDGSGLTNLTNNEDYEVAPSFSPDGQKIAFARETGEKFDIYTMTIDGNNITNLTNTEESNESYPSWSPEGDQIVFTTGGDQEEGVYTICADGTNRTYLTNMGGTGSCWSPNSKILFVSGSIVNDIVSDDIFVCNADGSGQYNLSCNTRWDENPCWSPDGTMIAFDSNGSIYTMNSNGANQVDLTNDPDNYYSSPKWSPDGETILFVRNDQLFTMSSDGSNIQPLKFSE